MSKRWYAVQWGEHYETNYGSHIKREARKMCTEVHRLHPGEEVRICYVTDESDFCEKEEVIYEWPNAVEVRWFWDW